MRSLKMIHALLLIRHLVKFLVQLNNRALRLQVVLKMTLVVSVMTEMQSQTFVSTS